MEELKNLLLSDEWPIAVEPYMICDLSSEEDKKKRAIAIIEVIIRQPLSNKRFLDFGCGEGHVAIAAKDKCIKSFGYDVKEQNWSSDILTTSLDKIKSEAPFDIILMYDVLDHAENETQVSILSTAKQLLAPNGTIYLRTHPWCSKHGAHYYYQLNKAYVHLAFSVESLAQMGYNAPFVTHRITHPIITYADWINSAKLIARNHYIDSIEVPKFFTQNQIVSDAIKMNWENSFNSGLRNKTGFPLFQLGQQFHDFTLVNS
jgi:2-polyprenyl-3-methyl-5-hydroxy-6-metoxy-1,4-benzoquinol methylase